MRRFGNEERTQCRKRLEVCMQPEKIKRMIDVCYLAKRIGDMLPELPSDAAPSYIRFLDTIHKLKEQNGKVKVSDISDALNLPRPGVTRTVKEMESRGYLNKVSSNEDGRITYLTITEKGEALSETYDRKYYTELSHYLTHISDEEADCAIETIKALYEVMRERRIHFE